MDVKQLFNEISEFNITEDNILDFVLSNNENSLSFFLYKYLLFSLLKTDEHIEPMIDFYYKLSGGSLVRGSFSVMNEAGEIQKLDGRELVDKAEKKQKEVISGFVMGTSNDLNTIINYARNKFFNNAGGIFDSKTNSVIQDTCMQIDKLRYKIALLRKKWRRIMRKMTLIKRSLMAKNHLLLILKKNRVIA